MSNLMTVEEFKALLKFIYETDSWPVNDDGPDYGNSEGTNEITVKAWADKEALNRGYLGGFDAHCKLNGKG